MIQGMINRAVLVASLAVASIASAADAPSYEPGTLLTAAQLGAVATQAFVKVDDQVLRVLRVDRARRDEQASAARTLVVNGRGLVGVSYNEVLVAKASPNDVLARVKALPRAAASTYVAEATGITVVRFTTLADAVAMRDRLREVLPGARVDVAVDYARPKAR